MTTTSFCLDLDESSNCPHTQWVMMALKIAAILILTHSLYILPARAALEVDNTLALPNIEKKVKEDLVYEPVNQGPYFDLPVTYNSSVKSWIIFYQTSGKRDFTRWLERSHRYIPKIGPVLEAQNLPRDLVYLAMIESGFSPSATSTAEAVGYWQFMKPTAQRYGLKIDWWVDERRDIFKSTIAAANYLNDLYKMFSSWYLAAAAYNMGEGRVRALVKKYNTKNYWTLAKKHEFPRETEQYIPKLIAAMLIAKSPKLYGFRDVKPLAPMSYVHFLAPGGTDLENMALYLNLDRDHLKKLNPEITKGFIPHFLKSYKIRIPPGALTRARQFAASNLYLSN